MFLSSDRGWNDNFRFPSGDYQGLNESPETYAHNGGFTGQFFWLEEVQAELEFPLYHFLFFRGGFFQGEKLKVIGTADQIDRIRQLLTQKRRVILWLAWQTNGQEA